MKRYLADTHAVVWFAAGREAKLGRAARRAFDGCAAGRSQIVISVVTLWEVALLHDDGKLKLDAGFAGWCAALEAQQGFLIEPLLRADVIEARALADLRDPHDRLIAGTALRLGVPLLTLDARMSEHAQLKTVW